MRLAPGTEAELAEAVRAADGPLEIRGGGTRAGLGNPVQAAHTLELGRLSGIILHEPAALTLVARAGTPLAEIEAALMAEGQMLAFEPMDHRGLYGTGGEPTIGGVVACNASGPRRVRAGACRDYLLGVRFVDGEGRQVKSGGRVMKNVTGYDLAKLLCGSHGTLGVLTEAAFKVLPRPEAAASLVIGGLPDEVAVAALAAALGSPWGVSGAAHLPGDGARTLVRLEGAARSVAYRAERLRERLGTFGSVEIEGESDWAVVRDAGAFHGRGGAVWRISVKPSDGPRLVAALRAGGLDFAHFYDWGGGLVWLRLEEAGDAGAAAIRGALREFGGHATLVRASGAVRAAVGAFQPEPGPLAAMARGLREKFDPRGILNPGRMG
ncbi:MAG TPA: glycolate oxidase subunit GlcE [Paracoccaceae bacterium]|nr:glycolate oxidase subunit GlcE [Paracoccaceae bacterium]